MAATGYYLIDHPNPHAKPDRDGRYHGYATRRSAVRCIVIHTAENTPDTVAADGGAEAVARYQARVERPSSYHDLVDSDSHVQMLPWDHTAFHASNANAWSIGLSMATKAHLWPSMPSRWTEATLDNLATVAAAAVRWAKATYGIKIPTITISKHAAYNGTAGFIAHGTLDPGRRTDPGATFPWGRFLSKTSKKLGQKPPIGDDDLSAEAEKKIDQIHKALFDGASSVGVHSVIESTNKTVYDLAGIGSDNTIRHFIQAQDKRTRQLAHNDATEILNQIQAVAGPGGGPLSDADVARIAEAVADEMSERLRA